MGSVWPPTKAAPWHNLRRYLAEYDCKHRVKLGFTMALVRGPSLWRLLSLADDLRYSTRRQIWYASIMWRQMKILRTIAISIVALALPVAAYAQNNSRGLDRKKEKEESAAEIQKRKADDKAYSESLSRLPPKEQYDPWASVREKAPAEKPSVVKKKPPLRPAGQ
jgi:hypothetical protein